MDRKGAVCGIRVYGISFMVFVEFRERANAGNVSSITVFVFPAGNTALKLLISLLHCQALKDKVGRNIVKAPLPTASLLG